MSFIFTSHFFRCFVIFLFAPSLIVLSIHKAMAAGPGVVPPTQTWPWTGFMGKFDRGSLQRGLKIYQENCSSCHSLDRIAFRNLTALNYAEDQIKALASAYDIEDGPNDDGEFFTRPGRPADRFPAPFPNKQAATAANGAYPPDLSLIIKSRASGKGHIGLNFLAAMAGRGSASGADYLYALLTGYDETRNPEDGGYFNSYYPGQVISMAQPLYADGIEFSDGTKATIEQQARDITAFLAWASEPELEQRKAMGIRVMLFLLVLLGLVIVTKRRLWATLH